MDLLNLAARAVAAVAHEVITEYRKIDAPEQPGEQDSGELSCVASSTERAWQPVVEAPATAFGFRGQQ